MDVDAPELRALGSYYRRRAGALWLTEPGDGMIAVAPLEPGLWEICRVYVHPDQHGTGLGRQLLATAERHAVEAGATRLVLWTDTRFHRAHAFYAKHGYDRDAEIRVPCPGVIEYRYDKRVPAFRSIP